MIVGIDRFMSEARALTNFAGNSVATLLVGTWTKTIDKDQVRRVLDGKDPYIAAEDDGDVNLRYPTVANPATETLQPTPQLNLDAYHGTDSNQTGIAKPVTKDHKPTHDRSTSDGTLDS